MLQQDGADDYVIATGEVHSVQELVEIAFDHGGLDWRRFVTLDPCASAARRSRSSVGDPSKARTTLGWKPSVDFPGLVRMMVDADLERNRSRQELETRS